MVGALIGAHCGVVLTRITDEAVNDMCDELVINWTVPSQSFVFQIGKCFPYRIFWF